MIRFEYNGMPLVITGGHYDIGGGLALEIVTATESYTVLTVNQVSVGVRILGPGEILVKAYSENGPIADFLRPGPWFKDTGRRVAAGFVDVEVWQCLFPVCDKCGDPGPGLPCVVCERGLELAAESAFDAPAVPPRPVYGPGLRPALKKGLTVWRGTVRGTILHRMARDRVRVAVYRDKLMTSGFPAKPVGTARVLVRESWPVAEITAVPAPPEPEPGPHGWASV